MNIIQKKTSHSFHVWALVLTVVGLAASGAAQTENPREMRTRQLQQAVAARTNIPDDVQLVNADSNPTIRVPIGHSSLNWTVVKPRIRASFGWLEIDRASVRYTLQRSSQNTKEPDQGFVYTRGELTGLKIEFTVAEFRAGGLRHFLSYSPENHWDAADSKDPSVNSIVKVDNQQAPLIVQALQNFDTVVALLKLRQQQQLTRPAAPAPVTPSAPPAAPPPVPPTLVVMAPSGVSENQTLEVAEPQITIRGAVMDSSGLPTIAINGVSAALRPKGANAAEFWSDPITLKPGDNPFEIEAASPDKAVSHFKFVARFAPKSAPVNPRALGKDDIVALLQGGVPAGHVTELVKGRGIKFTPTATDLNDVRAAGGTDEVIQAIQQAAGK
jgi:hypothetical protein